MAACGLVALALVAGACGGSDSDDGGGGGGGGSTATCVAGSRLDIGASGTTPACLRVLAGDTVTIANGRATAIEVRSAPHPTHGSCPEIDATAPIPAGGSVAVVMVTTGVCAFHDHATGSALGSIQVGTGMPGDPYNPL
jgi:hypothetical protein